MTEVKQVIATNIQSRGISELTFPHWIRRDKGNVYDILQHPDKQIQVGEKVAFDNTTAANSKYAFEVIKKDTIGKAKGDFSAYGFVPIIARITLVQNQYLPTFTN